MKNGKWDPRLGRAGTKRSAAVLRYLTLLPTIRRKPSLRNKIADVLLATFVLLSRSSFIIGGMIGGFCAAAKGFAIGIVAAGIVGFWFRRSVGLRGRDLTRGFFVRMSERGVGISPGLLESLIEKIRGHEITPHQCRLLSSAYAEFQRGLQSCDSIAERDELCKTLDRRVQAAFYGEPEVSAGPDDCEAARERVATEF